MFVNEEGRSTFLNYWKRHQLETGNIHRIVELDQNDDSESENESDEDCIHNNIILETRDSDALYQVNIDITNVANVIIGSKGLVIRFLKREYDVEATTVQNDDSTFSHYALHTPAFSINTTVFFC